MSFYKENIKNNFNKASKSYNNYAILQKNVADRLSKIIIEYIDVNNSKRIIDLGSGTGFLCKNLKNHIKNYDIHKFFQLDFARNMLEISKDDNIINIEDDIDNFFHKGKKFDYVISSLSFQWLENFSISIRNIKKILNKNGILIFSIISDGSLSNMQNNFNNIRINNFINEESLKNILQNNFYNFIIKKDSIDIEYKNFYDLLNSIKKIGARSSFQNKSIINKRDIFNLKNSGSISDNWNILYAICYS